MSDSSGTVLSPVDRVKIDLGATRVTVADIAVAVVNLYKCYFVTEVPLSTLP